MTTIFWFRRDLRLSDNPALIEAVTKGDGDVVALFIVDPALLASVGPARSAYLQATLSSLNDTLGGALTIRVGAPEDVLVALAREVGARDVFATEDFAPAGRRRDTQVAAALADADVTLHLLDSPYVVKPGTVKTKAGTPSKVFTPFRKVWELYPVPAPLDAPEGVRWQHLETAPLSNVTALSATERPDYFGDLPDEVPAFDPAVGERGALAALDSFLPSVAAYDEQRNQPGVEGTSRLSPHLRFGTIHPRQILARTDAHPYGGTAGSLHFRSEIGWREFYADVLFANPTTSWQNLQRSMDHLRVDSDAAAVERFQTWARGETGYPIVDAGMRQLLTEGWMHNRVRMITASFLIKHLHIDWRWGAKWFLWRLIDGDVASNQHGWQWTAGSGTDASPFYRIFNPVLQAERFDPDGVYVKRWVPELRDVAAPDCLQPGGGSGLLTPAGYFPPIIDSATERDEALRRYDEVKVAREAAARP
jgi:deoxyribodipyrimidine photo-lyase